MKSYNKIMNNYAVIKCCHILSSSKYEDDYGGIYEGGSTYGGTMKLLNGIQVTGTFYFGNLTGYGEKTTLNGTYKGNFINFKKNGHGKYTWKNGSWYEGLFKDDKIQGFGKIVSYNGCFIFEGEFHDDLPISNTNTYIPQYTRTNRRHTTNTDLPGWINISTVKKVL